MPGRQIKSRAAASSADSRVQSACAGLEVDDGTLNVVTAGAGPPVVMLHGWTLDHRMWGPQFALADRYRMIMPDRRGFGRSTAPPDLACEWRDIDRLVADERFALVGLSQGAGIAIDYARHRPERVSALVLAGAALYGVVPQGDASDAFPQARYATMVREGRIGAMKADWSQSPLVQVNAAAGALLAAMLADYDGRDLRAGAARLDISGDDIAALPMPVLAIAGAGDSAWRRDVTQFIAATAPQGQLLILDDAGHLCNLDNPAQFNAALADFLYLANAT